MTDPVLWYQSRSFKALAQTSVLLTLGWVLVGLSTNVWDWRAGLLVPIISNVFVALRDMWSPTVTGPFNVMNQVSIPPITPTAKTDKTP
jgi:hypothetical protein